jgi:hypothetical protein
MAKQSNSGTDPTDPRNYATNSITPSFNPEQSANTQQRSASTDALAAAESAASGTQPEGDNPSLTENQPLASRVNFTGTGHQNTKKTDFKALVKKGGPVILLGGFLAIIAVVMFTGQSSLPFALLSRSDQEFNTNSVVAHNRATTLFRYTLANNSNPALQGSVYGDHFRIGQKQQAKLIEAGFSFNTREANGVRLQTIKFGDTEYFANEEALSAYTSSVSAGNTVKYKVFDPSNPDDFEMSAAFNYATLTWTGKIATSFNYGVAQTLKRLGLDDRNRWNDKAMQKITDGSNQTDAADPLEIIANGTANAGIASNLQSDIDIQVEKPDGSLAIERKSFNNTLPTEGAVRTTAEKSARTSSAKNTLKQFASSQISASFSSVPCATMAVGSAVSALIMAKQNLSGTNMVQSTFNIFSQIMSGINTSDSLNAAHHDTLIGLTTPGTNGKSMIDSSAMAAIFGASDPNPNDPLVKELNNEQVINGLTIYGEESGILTANEMRSCQYATIAQAAASSGTDIPIDAITLIQLASPTNLFSGAARATAKVISRATAKITAATLAPFISSALSEEFMDSALNQLSQNMGFDLYSNNTDDPLAKERTGVAFAKYTKTIYDKLGQSAGLSFGTREAVIAMAREKQSYDNEIARLERSTRSPFDITSEHTFLGSIFYKTASLYSRFSSVGSGLNSLFSVVGSSFASILPSANAVGETNLAHSMSSDKECPLAASVGAAADQFCSPYIVADLSNIASDPADILLSIIDNFEQENGKLKLDENKNPIIRPKSDLMKYITTCTNLDSMLGLPNANEAEAKKTSNAGWASGAECVTGKHPEFERYINDQEQMESMGIINKSARTVALEKYYSEHPLDASYEGILARYSGLTKETVVAILDYADYHDFVASYSPSDRLPVEAPIIPTITDLIPEVEIASHSTKTGNILVSLISNPLFPPLRDRAVASA